MIFIRQAWQTADEVAEAVGRSAAQGEGMTEVVRWIRGYVVTESDGSLGMACLYQAASPEAIRSHALGATLPIDEIVAVAETVIMHPDPVPAPR